MSGLNPNYLLVFNYTHDTPVNLLKQIKRSKTVLQQYEHANHENVYLLYVTPKIPNVALCTPKMIKQFYAETCQAQSTLNRLGDILNIPQNRRFLRTGLSDWQARSLAKELSVQCIIGQSPIFQRLRGWLDKLAKHVSFQRLIKMLASIR